MCEIPKEFAGVTSRFNEVATSNTFKRILNLFDLKNKKILDLGCGYGEYLVNFGPGSVGVTSTIAEQEYGKFRNINIIQGNVERLNEIPLNEKFQAVWANNLFEHLLSPHAFLINMKTIVDDSSLLILGVPVIPRVASLMQLIKFRGALAVAHVNFFTRESLALTVERAGWKVISIRPFIFSNRYLDWIASFFAPHLYVSAYNNSTFTYHEKKLKEWLNEPHYKPLIDIVNKK